MRWFLVCALLLGATTAVDAASAAPQLVPDAELDLPALEGLVRQKSRAAEAAALEVALAGAELSQAHLRRNPTLELGWGTIPIGPSNPANLPHPLANVPNYEVALSYGFELGKRSPRIARAKQLESATRHVLHDGVRRQAIELARLLGGLATSSLKLQGLRGVLESGERLLELAEQRAGAGFATALDVERLRIDVSRTATTVRAEESVQAACGAACFAHLGTACAPFPDSEQARRFLTRWSERLQHDAGRPETRADVLALGALVHAAEAEAELARAQQLPDPTLRLGYVRDQFVASGAQQNSLNLSVAVPLPVFERGQAQLRAASARRTSYARQQSLAVQASTQRIVLLQSQLAEQIARQQAISADVIPRASGVLRDVEKAAALRLLPMSEVIQARRALAELLVEESDAYEMAFATSLELAAESSAPISTMKEAP